MCVLTWLNYQNERSINLTFFWVNGYLKMRRKAIFLWVRTINAALFNGSFWTVGNFDGREKRWGRWKRRRFKSFNLTSSWTTSPSIWINDRAIYKLWPSIIKIRLIKISHTSVNHNTKPIWKQTKLVLKISLAFI